MKSRIKIPKRSDASARRISDLIYTHNQRLSWAQYATAKGRTAEAEAHKKKAAGALKALKTLGYSGEI
jgi:hypothetical protein